NYIGVQFADGGAENDRVGADGHDPYPADERNIISGNVRGVQFSGIGDTDNIVAGNYIGTDVCGAQQLSNVDGLYAASGPASGNRIGTDSDGFGDCAERNIISGNRNDGINLQSGDHYIIAGNYIGTDVTGTQYLPNHAVGIEIWTPGSPTNVGDLIGVDI